MKVLTLLCMGAVLYAQAPADPLLKAMRDELERSRTLDIANLDKPYFLEYSAEDIRAYSVSATLGGILAKNVTRSRVPRIRVRVGDYAFDNSNYVFTDFFSGGAEMPIEDNYGVLRRSLWLATDRNFKGGVEVITRKRAALKNLTQTEKLPDFWKAPKVERILPVERVEVPLDTWTERIRKISHAFTAYPEVLSSAVTFDASDSTYYLVNSEGSSLRLPDFFSTVNIRATGQAADGMTIRDGVAIPVLDQKSYPQDAELLKVAEQVAERVKQLAAAPAGETYSGPVLFEGVAAAQIVAEVLGPQLALSRKPVGEPGRPVPFSTSEFEGRIGSRVLPEFIDVVDDPTQKAWKGTRLLGWYEFDYEGVVPVPVTLIEKGRLKGFLLSRQPVRGFEGSNGHARVPGPYGSNAAAIANLFVQASESVKKDELRAQFLKMVQDRGKPYGIIVRKMDFPTTAPTDELRRSFMGAGQGGGSRPVSTPLYVYRVYPDGKEELVRGLKFRGFSARTFRDIVAVSDENFLYSYLNTLAPMSMSGGGYVAPTSVVAPSLLFEDVELERSQDELPKLPVVPPPPLTTSR